MSDDWTLALEAHQAGDLAKAFALCNELVEAHPRHFGALNLLGAIAIEVEQPAQALIFLDQALRLVCDDPSALVNRGAALQKLGRTPEALLSYQRAVDVDPDFAVGWYNLGTAQKESVQLLRAVECFEKSLAINSNYAPAHFNLANTLHILKRFEEALHHFDRAIELNPEDAEARKNRAFTRLMIGDFVGGLSDFEWRWMTPPLDRAHRHRGCPQWNGSQSLEGKTILVHAEQGLGDTLQFCRFISRVKSMGPVQVVFEVQAPLVELMQTVDGADIVVPLGLQLPDYDYQIPLMSLPHALGTTSSTIPGNTPYLSVNQMEQIDRGAALLDRQSFKVGICWEGSVKGAEVGKAIPLSTFAPLAHCHGVQLISLQKQGEAIERCNGEEPFPLISFGADFDVARPFMDTASVMLALDLVISTDTSVAHLAGALGIPVWVALPYNCDWRWGPSSGRTPWYPTMRLFRQTEPGSWTNCFEDIRLSLEEQIRALD